MNEVGWHLSHNILSFYHCYCGKTLCGDLKLTENIFLSKMCDQVENNQVFLSVEMNSNFQSLRGCTTNSFSTPRLKGTA